MEYYIGYSSLATTLCFVVIVVCFLQGDVEVIMWVGKFKPEAGKRPPHNTPQILKMCLWMCEKGEMVVDWPIVELRTKSQ